MKLGIGIPYYKNSMICEQFFKYLMQILEYQVRYRGDVKVVIYEDGQSSKWLDEYIDDDIYVIRDTINRGLPYARNVLIKALSDCEYITFIDADDRISSYFVDTILEEIEDSRYDIYATDFYINNSMFDYEGLKNHVTGVIYKNELIKDIRFNEKRNVGEDLEFNQEVRRLDPSIKHINTKYFYNYGANKDCLTYRYSRDEITEFKGGDVH